MVIRVDNRGYMRAIIALRKAFDAAIERRRAGVDVEDVIDGELIVLMRDVLGDGGWTAFLTHAISTLDPTGIDDAHVLLTRIRTIVREQGLAGWIVVMNDEAERALDANEPSGLMLDSWAPSDADAPGLGAQERERIIDDSLADDMERFETDAKRIGATLLLRWADDDRDAVRLAATFLSYQRDSAALGELARGLLESGAIDDQYAVDCLRDYAEDPFSDIQPYERRVAALAAKAYGQRADDPLWRLRHGEAVKPAEIDWIHAEGDARLARLMGDLPAACADDIIDAGDTGEGAESAGLGPDVSRRYEEQERAWIHDVYHTVRGFAELWGLPAQIAKACERIGDDNATDGEDGEDDLTSYMERYDKASGLARERFLAKRHPGRADDPWLDQGWLGENADGTLGALLFGDDLENAYGEGDEQGFATQAGMFALMVRVTRCVGMLRMPAVFVSSARSLALEHAGDDVEAMETHVHWEQLACADLAGVLLRRIPDAPVARALALELLRGDLARYAVAADLAYDGQTPSLDEASSD